MRLSDKELLERLYQQRYLYVEGLSQMKPNEKQNTLRRYPKELERALILLKN